MANPTKVERIEGILRPHWILLEIRRRLWEDSWTIYYASQEDSYKCSKEGHGPSEIWNKQSKQH